MLRCSIPAVAQPARRGAAALLATIWTLDVWTLDFAALRNPTHLCQVHNVRASIQHKLIPLRHRRARKLIPFWQKRARQLSPPRKPHATYPVPISRCRLLISRCHGRSARAVPTCGRNARTTDAKLAHSPPPAGRLTQQAFSFARAVSGAGAGAGGSRSA